MTERMTDMERQALIAGDRAGTLEPEQVAELPLLADLLANPGTWAEPSAGLEDDVVNAVMNDEPSTANVTTLHGRRRATRRRTRIMIPAAAAAAIAVVVGSVMTTSGGAGPAFTARLAATQLVPGAHASAAVTRNDGGFRITLDAAGLQSLPQGAYYEAWLKDPAGTLVPIGTFSSSDEHITLWSGVSPETFTTLTVTIENPDNNQASSGQVVLRGDIRPG